MLIRWVKGTKKVGQLFFSRNVPKKPQTSPLKAGRIPGTTSSLKKPQAEGIPFQGPQIDPKIKKMTETKVKQVFILFMIGLSHNHS